MNSFTSPNEAFVLSVPASTREKAKLEQISALSTGLTEKLALDQGEEFWFTGAAPDKQVHGFIMKPHGYEKGKKYGMAFLVHGKSSFSMLRPATVLIV
jgi:dipeptidyl aminopeptidase/acylaminoacyl peptidase